MLQLEGRAKAADATYQRFGERLETLKVDQALTDERHTNLVQVFSDFVKRQDKREEELSTKMGRNTKWLITAALAFLSLAGSILAALIASGPG